MKLEAITDISGRIRAISGLHIGGGDLQMRIGGVDNAIIRDPRSNAPYIPGSSLKGKIRSLLEWRSGAVQEAPLGLGDLARHAGTAREAGVLAIIRIFGVAGDADADARTIQRIGPTRVAFQDALLIPDARGSNEPVTEIKSENMIDRLQGVARHPRQTERVAAGVSFAFRVTVKRLEGDGDLVSTLLEGMRLLELDSLGGSGSRGYGKVKFEGLVRDGAPIQEQFDAIDPFSPGSAAA